MNFYEDSESSANSFFQERGGMIQMLSPLTNAHLSGVLWFLQISGLECLHPKVCSSDSPGASGRLRSRGLGINHSAPIKIQR
jgi:hypothetical protein